MEFTTLAQALLARATGNAGITFVESEQRERQVSYAELLQRALGVLGFLQRQGVKPGEELILCTDNSLGFVDAFWACMLGGIVPVPLAAPSSREQRRRILTVLGLLRQPTLLTGRSQREKMAAYAASENQEPLLRAARTLLLEDIPAGQPSGSPHTPAAHDIALIQFSSGSTGQPKGVVLTHQNLLSNIRSIQQSARLSSSDSTLSWMPLTHDMGLIGFHLLPLVAGMRQHLLPPELFVRKPLLWLQAASRSRATALGSPNFGYRHLLEALQRSSLRDCDLSAVRLIFNGAEPISPQLCEQFQQALAPHGLRPNAIFPVYGLAEAALAVAFAEPAAALQVIHLQRDALGVGSAARQLDCAAANALSLVSVGQPLESSNVRIADADGRLLPDGSVGQLQISGEGVTAGYYAHPALLREGFTADGWLNTGDLAVSLDSLYIVGREKDTIIVNGQNFHAHDLERLCESLPGLAPGRVACVRIPSTADGSDSLAVFLHWRRPLAECLPLLLQVRDAVMEGAGVEVHAIIPLPLLPKTSSGKLQRFALRDAWLRGDYTQTLAELQAIARASELPKPEPLSEMQRMLKTLCSEVLRGREIGLNDNLIDCGADSLALASIALAIDERYPNVMTVEDFLEYPTIAALAPFLERRCGNLLGKGAAPVLRGTEAS